MVLDYTKQSKQNIMILKSYSKTHLAHMYSPKLSADSARRRLNRWISGDKQLMTELQKVGFYEHHADHYYTKREVALLFEYIGDPAA